MKCSVKLIFALTIIIIVRCEKNDDDDYYENYFEDKLRPEDMVDPHSFFYDEHNKEMNKGEHQSSEILSQVKVPKLVDNHSSQEVVFYKRLINLLLTNIRIQDEDEIWISGILKIEISPAEMKTLKNFAVNKTSLREIDEILSNAIKKPEFDYINSYGVRYIFGILQQGTGVLFDTIQSYPDGAMMAFTMLMVLSSFKMLKWSRGFPIVALMQIMFILSFFMTWWNLIQEAEAKLMAAQSKYTQVPISCHPDKMSYWDKLISLFYNDDCEQYYKTIMSSNSKLKVTPIFVLSHFITTVILYPITHVGTIISVFIRNATDDLPFIYAWIVKCMLYLCVGVVVIMLPICLSGASIYLPFGFGIGYFRHKTRQGNSVPSIEKREPVQIIFQMSQGTDVLRVTDTLEAEQSKAIEAAKPESEDASDKFDNLSAGDTASKMPTNENENWRIEEVEGKKMKEHDGSGDN